MAQVDLASLPKPTIIDELSFDDILDEILTTFRGYAPEYTNVVEGDPAYAVLQVAAYREVAIRQKVNDAVRAVLIPFANGSDLDNIAVAYGVFREIITQADPTANPPTEAVVESDESLRARVLRVFESITPGSKDWYEGLALAVNPNIREVQAISGTAGAVTVYIQTEDNNGLATDALVTEVETDITSSTNKFFGDAVTVAKATQVSYAITAALTLLPGASATMIQADVTAQGERFCDMVRRLAVGVPISGIYAALSHNSVASINLTAPTSDISVNDGEIPVCSAVTITIA